MLGDVVRNLREARGWTQAELARRVGVNSAQINRLEAGKSKNPTQQTLDRLASTFGLTSADLLTLTAGSLPGPVNQLRVEGIPGEALLRLASMWGDLTDADREAVIEITRRIWEGRTAQNGELPVRPNSV